MDKKNISEVLRSLASGEKNRPEIARLRDVFDAVEAAISAGVSRVAILEALHGQGFTMTLKTFDNAIYRIRKRNLKLQKSDDSQFRKQAQPNQESVLHSTKIQPAVDKETPPVSSHNPDDLTKIMSAPVDLEALSKHSKRKR